MWRLLGSTGLIGSALGIPRLRADGHRVIKISRRTAGEDEVQWNPNRGTDRTGESSRGSMQWCTCAGAGVGDHSGGPLNLNGQTIPAVLMEQESREGIGSLLATPPSVLLSGSAVSFYGVRGDEVLTSISHAGGTGFLADVCARWEAAASELRLRRRHQGRRSAARAWSSVRPAAH